MFRIISVHLDLVHFLHTLLRYVYLVLKISIEIHEWFALATHALSQVRKVQLMFGITI